MVFGGCVFSLQGKGCTGRKENVFATPTLLNRVRRERERDRTRSEISRFECVDALVCRQVA